MAAQGRTPARRCANAAPATVVGDDVVWLKGNAYEKIAPTHSQETHQPDFSHGAPAPSFRVIGGRHARDDKATAKNRYCIFGSLFDRHRNRRNRYMDSPKT